MRSTARTTSVLLALALSVTACARGNDTATNTTSAPTSSTAEQVQPGASDGAAGPSIEDGGGEVGASSEDWEEVAPGSGCMCSDGSEFSFLVHPGSTEHVLFYLQSGGACFTAELCVPNETYRPTLHDIPPETDGIFDFDHAGNPFTDYTVVYVPYCSGDVFLGDATTEYSADLTVQHAGFANASAALD